MNHIFGNETFRFTPVHTHLHCSFKLQEPQSESPVRAQTSKQQTLPLVHSENCFLNSFCVKFTCNLVREANLVQRTQSELPIRRMVIRNKSNNSPGDTFIPYSTPLRDRFPNIVLVQ